MSVFFLLAILASLLSCSKDLYKKRPTIPEDGKYDTEFPSSKCSAQLENILQSVKKVNCYTNYRTYVFGENSKIILKDLHAGQLLEKAEASLSTNEATSGTALVVFSNGSSLAILTCAHVVALPDTVIAWSEFSDLESNRYIQSISFKQKQQITIRDIPEGNRFKLLALDQKKDLAILGRTLSQPSFTSPVPAFPYPAGNSGDIQWGSFIYLAGYPSGQLMVTKGITSKASTPSDNFLTDAPFNEGFSGGIALAIRDGVPNFELVGIGRSVSARTEYFLKPEKENYEYSYNAAIPYTGPVYVNQKKDINYGVTWIVPVNSIREFYNTHRDRLRSEGFDMDDFFLEKE